MGEAKSLYDEDFLLWSKEQAEALRAAAEGRANLPLDWERIAEEIEDLGRSHRSALRSYILRIVQHLVKLAHSQAVEPQRGWRRSIRAARIHARQVFRDNPSLKTEVPALIEDGLADGIELAIADLEEYGEVEAAEVPMIRRASFTEEQVLGDWFPER